MGKKINPAPSSGVLNPTGKIISMPTYHRNKLCGTLGRCWIKLKIIPRSSENKIVGESEDGVLKIKLTAPPVEGEANKKLIGFLSKEWGIPKSEIKIVSGLKSKNKIVEIEKR